MLRSSLLGRARGVIESSLAACAESGPRARAATRLRGRRRPSWRGGRLRPCGLRVRTGRDVGPRRVRCAGRPGHDPHPSRARRLPRPALMTAPSPLSFESVVDHGRLRAWSPWRRRWRSSLRRPRAGEELRSASRLGSPRGEGGSTVARCGLMPSAVIRRRGLEGATCRWGPTRQAQLVAGRFPAPAPPAAPRYVPEGPARPRFATAYRGRREVSFGKPG